MNKVLFFIAIAFAGVLGCSPEAPKLQVQQLLKVDKVSSDENVSISPSSLDMLFIVDNSGSMQTHQTNLINNISDFVSNLSSLGGLDYHIGVITSDDGYLNRNTPQAFSSPQDPMAEQILLKALDVGTSGDSSEKFFDPLVAALSKPLIDSRNLGFLRDDAYLIVIFLTDTEDQSVRNSPKSAYDFLVKLKGGDERKVLIYGVMIPENANFNCTRDDYPNGRLEGFLKLKDPTLANQYELCSPDFGKQIATLGSKIAKEVGRNVIYLSKAPVVETIQVNYGTQALIANVDEGWSYDGARNAIVLGKKVKWTKQPDGTKVTVKYTAAKYE